MTRPFTPDRSAKRQDREAGLGRRQEPGPRPESIAAPIEKREEGWQPIETAPKDGTWIIGVWKNVLGELGVVPVRWGVSWDNQYWANGVVVYEPTHWRPLPEPPVSPHSGIVGEERQTPANS